MTSSGPFVHYFTLPKQPWMQVKYSIRLLELRHCITISGMYLDISECFKKKWQNNTNTSPREWDLNYSTSVYLLSYQNIPKWYYRKLSPIRRLPPGQSGASIEGLVQWEAWMQTITHPARVRWSNVMASDEIDRISRPETLIDTDKADLLFKFYLGRISAAINP